MSSLFDRFENDDADTAVNEVQPEDDPLLPPTTIEDLRRSSEVIGANYDVIKNVVENLVPVSEQNTIYNQLSFVRDINYCFLKNQAMYFCIYSQGPLGVGKSSLAIQALQQLLGKYDYDGNLVEPCMDWKKIQAHIIYHPLTFIKIIKFLQKNKLRIKCLIWDDSGIYLNAKDWQKNESKEIAKWFQIARSYVGSIILTTPSPSLLLRDIRRLSMVTIEVKFSNKTNGGFDSLYSRDKRIAYSYDHWYLPDLTKARVHLRARDRYSVKLPDNIYYPYKQLRDSYNDLQIDQVVTTVTGQTSDDDRAFNDGVDVGMLG